MVKVRDYLSLRFGYWGINSWTQEFQLAAWALSDLETKQPLVIEIY